MSTKYKTIDADTFTELVDALDVLMRKWQRKDESYVRLIAHQGNTKAQARVREWDEEDGSLEVPDTFHDGSPITSVKDLSTVMGISEWSAAVYVQDKGARHPLYTEAKEVIKSEFAGTAALMLIPRNAGKFTVDGGVEPKDMHCTLFYAGDIKTMPVKTQDEFLDFARSLQLPIIDASVNGQTVFYNEPDKPVFVLNVDSPQLEAARRKVMDGIDVPQTHGYSPHMTVKYLDKGEALPKAAQVPVQVVFDTLRVAYDGKDVDIPLVPAQTMDKIDVETKGIRRVRTPEGARRYGQPIGSIIVRDVRLPSLPDKHKMWTDNDGFDWLKTDTATLGELLHQTDTYSVRLKVMGSGAVLDVRDRVRGRLHSTYVRPEEWTKLTPAKRKALAVKMAEDQMPNFTEPGDPYYKYDGLRGFDWRYEGDEEMSTDLANLDDRWSWAMTDADELGIEWSSGGNDEWFDELDVRAVEAVNNVMRQHEDWFPGFTDVVVNRFETRPSHYASSTAYASASMPKGFFGSKSDITLYRAFWTESEDSTVRTKREGAVRSSWSSASIDKIATEHNMDTFTAAAHLTITHEIGHAIINQIGTEKGLVFDDEFHEGLKEILVENEAWDERREQPLVSAVTKEVSKYGASQTHELLAEVWASYVLSSQPTALVEDIGRYMEEKLTEHMEGQP